MEILVSEDGTVTLGDLDVFTSFSVRTLTSDPATVERALRRVGPVSSGATHVYVPVSWLIDQAGDRAKDAAWRNRLDGMVAYAERSGWTNAGGGIRAHVEW